MLLDVAFTASSDLKCALVQPNASSKDYTSSHNVEPLMKLHRLILVYRALWGSSGHFHVLSPASSIGRLVGHAFLMSSTCLHVTLLSGRTAQIAVSGDSSLKYPGASAEGSSSHGARSPPEFQGRHPGYRTDR